MGTNEPKYSTRCCRFGDWLTESKSVYFKPKLEIQNMKPKVVTVPTENSAQRSLSKSKQVSTKLKMIFRHNYNIDKSLDIYKKTNIYTRLRLYNAAKLIPRVMTNYKSRRPVSKLIKVDSTVSAISPKQEHKEKKNEIRHVTATTEKKSEKQKNIFGTIIPRQSVTKESKKELITMTKITLDANSLLPTNSAMQINTTISSVKLQREKLPKKAINIIPLAHKPNINVLSDEPFFLPFIKGTQSNNYNNTNNFNYTTRNYYSQPTLPKLFKNKGFYSSERMSSSYNNVLNNMLSL